MLSTKNIDTTKETRGANQFISYGIGKYKITDIEVKTSSKNSKQCILHMETPPVNVPDFQGYNGALGQIGKAKMPKTWLVNEDHLKEFMKNIAIIGDKLGKRTQIDALSLNGLQDLESYVTQVKAVIGNKFLYWKLAAEVYFTSEGKKRESLFIPRYQFVASLEEGPDHLKFDKDSIYDYVPAEVPDNQTVDVDPFTG